MYCYIILAPLEAFSVPNAPTSFLASVFLYSLYYYNFSIYSSHPPLPTYHYFFLLPFLLLLIPLTGSICSQATLNLTQTERKKKPSQLETSTPQDNHPILVSTVVCSFDPCTAQVNTFSLFIPL